MATKHRTPRCESILVSPADSMRAAPDEGTEEGLWRLLAPPPVRRKRGRPKASRAWFESKKAKLRLQREGEEWLEPFRGRWRVFVLFSPSNTFEDVSKLFRAAGLVEGVARDDSVPLEWVVNVIYRDPSVLDFGIQAYLGSRIVHLSAGERRTPLGRVVKTLAQGKLPPGRGNVRHVDPEKVQQIFYDQLIRVHAMAELYEKQGMEEPPGVEWLPVIRLRPAGQFYVIGQERWLRAVTRLVLSVLLNIRLETLRQFVAGRARPLTTK